MRDKRYPAIPPTSRDSIDRPRGVKKSPWALTVTAILLAGWLTWLTSLAIRVGQ